MRKAIDPRERLALTLRHLATGESFRSLEFQFRINRKAISYIVIEVCDAIFKTLQDEVLKFPCCDRLARFRFRLMKYCQQNDIKSFFKMFSLHKNIVSPPRKSKTSGETMQAKQLMFVNIKMFLNSFKNKSPGETKKNIALKHL